MSNIIFNNIDVTFPVAGQDNPSKGFRDNWSYIQGALSTAKSEISTLESSALLKHTLADNNTPAENDLLQSTIINGSYKEFYGSSHNITPAANTTVIPINVANGDIQQVNLVSTAVTINFTGWPEGTQYGKVRVHFTTTAISSLNVTTFTSQAALSVKKDDAFPVTFTVDPNTHEVIEAWSFNNGATVFLKYLGNF